VTFPSGTTEHPINKSGKRKILVSVWNFGATHPQSERSHYASNDHPAKMRPRLVRAILELYGESPVLDPMAGIGTTLIEAMLLGMNAVGVEYEKKFVDQANKNIKHLEKTSRDKKLEKAVCIQGDARDLSCLKGVNISKLGSILLSPPYFNSVSHGKFRTKIHVGHHKWAKRGNKNINLSYSKDPLNIGNIPRFGSILFSPPYEGALNASKHVGGIASRDPQLAKTGSYSKDKENIGNKIGQSYLGEMLKVYRECYRVLKPGKFMIVVVKDIQRNWKTIPLGADTIKLCQLAGFDCHDITINKMYFPSFWMLSLAKKSQTKKNRLTKRFHAMKTHEYILVFRKS
jgi:DNA modification methylase